MNSRQLTPHQEQSPATPNPSFNRRPTPAGSVSLASARGSIVAVQAYAACLRGRR